MQSQAKPVAVTAKTKRLQFEAQEKEELSASVKIVKAPAKNETNESVQIKGHILKAPAKDETLVSAETEVP